ncbi:SMI1/KNR4 family protein [Flavobacterium inviolabile]|uniref:SMI1/KNR4 family protein n=1 Tax=Flavobacterium inviolabile TaxID=2748320 RepID=UPI0015AA5AD3|nr:SMI1/KNR4 family protein [Flavobacterium inviolabile]
MTDYSDQIQRIQTKLITAQKTDTKLQVFGADSHKYKIKKPVTEATVLKFEQQFTIQLPECYRTFITEVGNSGVGYANAAPGPYYGIYPFGENVDELIEEKPEKYLKNNCLIYPKITDNDWYALTKNIDENDSISDIDYEIELGKIFGGILPIGSQGCTYIHGLVLNGQHKGRIINLDANRQKPYFSFEDNFLDWYERWLDEVISGELIANSHYSFGFYKGGSEEVLWNAYLSSADTEEKKDCLQGLLQKNRLQDQTLMQIENHITSNPEQKTAFVQLICKSDYEKAKPHLETLVTTDQLSVFQFIFWYAKDKSEEWLNVITATIDTIQDEETFRFCTYILTATNNDYGNLIVPFTKNENVAIRIQAYYTLGQLKNKKDFLSTFTVGLYDSSNHVIRTTLQALSGVKDDSLLEHFQNLVQRFPKEQDSILVNLNHRLTEYNHPKQLVMQNNTVSLTVPAKKKWYVFWKKDQS